MENNTRVIISLSEGKIDVSGSEEFVRDQLDRFKDLIEKKLFAIPVQPQQTLMTQTPLSGAPNVSPPPAVTVENAYPNVIEIHEDKIKILKIKGATKAEKTLNTAFLYLLAKKQRGVDTANFDEIRKVCREHGCLDSTNFSKPFSAAKESFIVSGSPRNKSVSLTQPGLAKAKSLASDLNTQ